jgi:hypothetical protein
MGSGADMSTLDTILVDSSADTDESGSRFDKGGVLAALESGDLKLASITLLECMCIDMVTRQY